MFFSYRKKMELKSISKYKRIHRRKKFILNQLYELGKITAEKKNTLLLNLKYKALKYKHLTYKRSSIDTLKLRCFYKYQYFLFNNIKRGYHYNWQFYKYWIAFFFDFFMKNVRLPSMGKAMTLVFRYLKKPKYHFRSMTKSYLTTYKKIDSKFRFFKNLLTKIIYFKGIQSRRFIKKTSKYFGMKKAFRFNLRTERNFDYLKFRLSLFFISTFNMSLKSARLIYTEYSNSEKISTFKDFFLFLDRKIDFFLQHYFSYSVSELQLFIKYKLLYINNIAVTNLNKFVDVGDFIQIKTNAFHITFNLFTKKWFYFFFFLNHSQYFKSNVDMNKLLLNNITSIFFFFFMQKSTRFFNNNRKRTTSLIKLNFISNYLEIINGITSYLFILYKKTELFYESLSWYINIYVEKKIVHSIVANYNTIYELNLVSCFLLKELTNLYVSNEIFYITTHIFLKLARSWTTRSIIKKSDADNLKPFHLEYRLSLSFWYKNWSKRKRRKYITLTRNKKYCLLSRINKQITQSEKRFILNFKAFKIYYSLTNLYSYIYRNSNYLYGISMITLLKQKEISSFFSEILYLKKNIFFHKSNSFSYWWYFYTLRLSSIIRKNSSNEFVFRNIRYKYKAYSNIFRRVRLINYNSVASKRLNSDLSYKQKKYNKQNLFFKKFYYTRGYYDYPYHYFESWYALKPNLYNQQYSFLSNELKYLVYNFYMSLTNIISNSFISYKNSSLIYKLPKKPVFFENHSKWFSTFNLKDISNKIVSHYI